ncbi:hypothetical protein ASZ90_018458 [hydrocarbon metagenome]|uniref:Uncharacterized protein n=1 Tax=hydrocarbon metagenome TaxID=938273 RepID=A0A0W8E6P5_9ZZZZ
MPESESLFLRSSSSYNLIENNKKLRRSGNDEKCCEGDSPG